jgi:hypothetical protein
MSWAYNQETSRVEDKTYSLLDLFGINMPLLYGERTKAFDRLQEEILRINGDYSISAHGDEPGDIMEELPTSKKH